MCFKIFPEGGNGFSFGFSMPKYIKITRTIFHYLSVYFLAAKSDADGFYFIFSDHCKHILTITEHKHAIHFAVSVVL